MPSFLRFLSMTISIGHWISTIDGSALLTTATYDRLMQLVADRKGQGIPKDRVPASNKRDLQHIQDPGYIEQNLCGNR
jgi:hypothetical protein